MATLSILPLSCACPPGRNDNRTELVTRTLHWAVCATVMTLGRLFSSVVSFTVQNSRTYA